MLFSLEEGASFWNQSLTWMTFFASAMSSFTLNTILSAYYHVPGKLSYPGLLNLGKSETSSYELYELPMYALMGGFGGLVGALWIKINYKMAVFRNRYTFFLKNFKNFESNRLFFLLQYDKNLAHENH